MLFWPALARRLARLELAAPLLLVPIACVNGDKLVVDPQQPEAPQGGVVSLVISPQAVTVGSGYSVDFTAVGLTSSGDTAPITVTWLARKGTVTEGGDSKPGKRKGHYKSPGQPGPDTVIVNDDDANADTAIVNVTDTAVASVTVTPASSQLDVGTSLQLTALVQDSGGNALTGRSVTWSTSAAGIAAITGTGLVTAVGTGLATITATSEGQSGTAAITVVESAGGSVITDPYAVFTVPQVAKPDYLSAILPAPFRLPVIRVANDPGTAFSAPNGSGVWGSDARHHYSKDQPWSADGSMLALQNGDGGSPGNIYLDGATYTPKLVQCDNYSKYDDRWHPRIEHASERINARGAELMWFNVVTCVKTRSWALPFAIDGMMSEGNPSLDGRFLALSDGTRMFVVDMDPQAPNAPYPSSRIGPSLDARDCGLAGGCEIDWVSISPSGKYVVVTYFGAYVRVYDVNPQTLALTPRPMPKGYPGCAGTPAQGFIYDLGHSDMTLNPFDNDEDVIIGQEHCGNRGDVVEGRAMGGVVMVRLRDGLVTPLTDPANEAYPHHISTRNYQRLGWAYVGYYPDEGARFNDEIIAVKLDGSGTVERYAHKHSVFSGCYRCESHAVPSPDGRRVLWASNWALYGNGTTSVVQAYVVDGRPQ